MWLLISWPFPIYFLESTPWLLDSSFPMIYLWGRRDILGRRPSKPHGTVPCCSQFHLRFQTYVLGRCASKPLCLETPAPPLETSWCSWCRSSQFHLDSWVGVGLGGNMAQYCITATKQFYVWYGLGWVWQVSFKSERNALRQRHFLSHYRLP